MARQELILLSSEKMDNNKKQSRNEHELVRMAASVRRHMGFNDESVEIYPSKTLASARTTRSRLLTIFKAFSADIKKARKMIENDELAPEDMVRIGFVTTKTFNEVNGKNGRRSQSMWISNTVYDTVIGSDPEFLLFDNADDVIIRANSVMSKTGKLGSDGPMAELRPDPSIDVKDHVANMMELFTDDKYSKVIQPYRWMAGCYFEDNSRDYPVGGHIHIGNPKQIANLPGNTRRAFFIILNKIMDELLAIPMIKLDGADKGSRRRTNCKMAMGNMGYGYFGEMRTGQGRLEHRTLSGMWLTSPSLAKAVLGTAKAIAEEVFRLVVDRHCDCGYMCLSGNQGTNTNGRKIWSSGYDGWRKVPLLKDVRCTSSSDKMIGLLHKSNPSSINATYLKKWLSTIRGFSTFKDNEHYIRGLYEILRISAKRLQDWDKNIKTNWVEGKKYMVEV